MWLDLFLISIIVCFVIDISGIVDSIKKLIWKWVFNRKKEYQDFSLKPFDCSLCSTFWLGLIWIICNSQFTLLNIVFVCLFAALSEEITGLIMIIKQLLHRAQDDIVLKLITRNE